MLFKFIVKNFALTTLRPLCSVILINSFMWLFLDVYKFKFKVFCGAINRLADMFCHQTAESLTVAVVCRYMNKNDSFRIACVACMQTVYAPFNAHVCSFNTHAYFARNNAIFHAAVYKYISVITFNKNIIQGKIEPVFNVMRIRQKQHRAHLFVIDNKATRLLRVMLGIKSLHNKIADIELFKCRYRAVMKRIWCNTAFFKRSFCGIYVEGTCVLAYKFSMVSVTVRDETATYLADIAA